MDTEMLTYKELATRLGVKLDSARKMVRRKGWRRVVGNDGATRIAVPVDVLSVPTDSPREVGEDSPQDNLVPLLEERIEGLKALVEAERRRADAAERDRDAWRAMAERPLWKRLFR